jgi:Type VI secretion system, TssO
MHPLNHKERQDKFFYFVVLFTLTIVVTAVAFYSTNSMVTDAMARNNAAKTSQFFNYRQNQQDYVNQLTRLNQALSTRNAMIGGKSAFFLIGELKQSIYKHNDTSLLLNRISETYISYESAVGQRNSARAELELRQRDLDKCLQDIKSLNP